MKFFRKMDEMEQSIALRSLRIAYLFSLLFLIGWLICLFVRSGGDPRAVTESPAFLLLISQNAVLLGAQLILTRRMGS